MRSFIYALFGDFSEERGWNDEAHAIIMAGFIQDDPEREAAFREHVAAVAAEEKAFEETL